MATELPTDPQIAVDADRYLAQRVLALEAEVERLRESIAQFVYANDTEVSDDRPITPEEWEADWETAMSGLRAALAGEGGET